MASTSALAAKLAAVTWPFLTFCNLCSRFGRGYPDISAQALDYQFIINGETYYLEGTACAVSVRYSLFPTASALRRPVSSTQLTANVQTMAGMVSLLNDFLLSQNKHELGFLNPLLYLLSEDQVASVNDIKIGANPGCNTGGFPATAGWDPVRPAALVSFQSHFRGLADFLLYTRSLV